MVMETVYIPHLLQQPAKTLSIDIEAHLPGLDTLTPVRGQVTLTHEHTYLAVKGRAETIVTLTCHRCLQNYNHRVVIAPEELIWLENDPDPATLPLEREVGVDDLIETLPPHGHFDPATWLYEQICLALPQRQICDSACPGIQVPTSPEPVVDAPPVDSRWSVLTQLQQQLNQPGS
jgi:uncharacterized protein